MVSYHLIQSLHVPVTDLTMYPSSQRTNVRERLVSTLNGTMPREVLMNAPYNSQRFVDIHEQKKLVPPAYSGHVLAALAVKADKSLSGQFVNYSDESMSAYQPS